MLGLFAERDELRVVADQVSAPTRAAEIAQATAAVIVAALAERAEGRFVAGLFHLTAGGATSCWHGFTAAILDGARRNGLVAPDRFPRLVPVASEEYPRPAARPKNSRLAGDRLHERFGLALRHEAAHEGRCPGRAAKEGREEYPTPMPDEQAQAYRALIMEASGRGERTHGHMLNALHRLRAISLHPGDPVEGAGADGFESFACRSAGCRRRSKF